MLASIPNLITHTRLPIIRRSSSCKASPPGNQSMIGNSTCEEIIVRRTANYHPPIWDYDYVQSLRSDYVLKRDVKLMLGKVKKPLDQLELIHVLQRLGLYYHFKDEIKRILDSIYNQYNQHEDWKKDDLYATALEFRLLRQHGYDVPEGMLCLYEASYLVYKEKGLEQSIDQNLAIEVNHALELPLHWRMPRLEARWFIDVYEKRQDMNPILLEFAKLDFNMVQATHQEDLRHMSSWWRSTRLGEKLNFARDRLMENFLWTVATFITFIDDVYDVYGTLDELELFTDAVDRWDINAMDPLPEYMKLCFLALYNSTNEMAYDALKEHGLHLISYLRKADELKRGDVPKSIQCYMYETGASEEDARKHISYLIGETWKKLNEDQAVESPFPETFIGIATNLARTAQVSIPETFIRIATNLARMAQCMYQHGDGHGIEDGETKDRVLSLLIEPIPVHRQ
ncbi:hypothetical protein AAG906_033299 [Vitis piasezkii]